MYTYFLYVSLCFGNSHSCFQIKSSDYRDGVSVKLKYLNSYDYIFNPVLWKTLILDLGKTCLFCTKTNPKEIGADISIFLGSSVLYWHIVKQSSIFVRDPIFNLRFFVRVFSKALIVDYVVFPMQLIQICLTSWVN